MTAVETPSGKDAAYENFPVGSFLLPPAARPHVAVFYGFARAIDDIADSPALSPDDKLSRLGGFVDALEGQNVDPVAFETGVRMRQSLIATGIPTRHCLDLIDAFKQDAVKSRYDDWDDLMRYCTRSAAPVGRYLIDLTGGTDDEYRSSDALCNALQVINHLQDCKDDYQSMDRVYLPMAWMTEAGADVGMLNRTATTPELRAVIDRCLVATRTLMNAARPLPRVVRSRRLAMESAAIVNIADMLIGKLSRRDPLTRRVTLNKVQYAGCIARGIFSPFFS